ncbi:MAG TPA: ethanolamine ammonia-lyase subunit EutC [Opitutaceae bacterium]|nr:ethanolamine ammonia-lyase subunit EutC [Opitutaceae bacterium]
MPSLETTPARAASAPLPCAGAGFTADQTPVGGDDARATSATSPAPATFDTWGVLAQHTSARIALGRAGGSARTGTLLDFRLSHARARDAVQMQFDAEPLCAALRRAGLETVQLETAAADRRTFLVRPDLGRMLTPLSRSALLQRREIWGCRDLAIIVSDGLSALAAERQVGPVLTHLVPLLRAAGWSLFPILLAPFGRVKLQDEVGELLGARHTLMLLGERPGLGSPDSLGAYFTFMPRAACTDADRNCISNIRPEGFPPKNAAQKIAQLLLESARRGLSGVALKDAGDDLPLPLAAATRAIA